MLAKIKILLSLLICLIFSNCLKQIPTLQTASIEEDMYGVSIQFPFGLRERTFEFVGVSFEYLKKTSDRSNLSIMLYPHVLGLGLKCSYKYRINNDNEKIDYALNPNFDLGLSLTPGISIGADAIFSNKNEDKLYGGAKFFVGAYSDLGGGNHSYGGYGPFIGIADSENDSIKYYEYFLLKYSEKIYHHHFGYKRAYPKEKN